MAETNETNVRISVIFDKINVTQSFSDKKESMYYTGSSLNKALTIIKDFLGVILDNPENKKICNKNYLFIEKSFNYLFAELLRNDRNSLSKIEISNVIIDLAVVIIEEHIGQLSYDSHPQIQRESEAGTTLYHIADYLYMKFVQLVTFLITDYSIKQIHL